MNVEITVPAPKRIDRNADRPCETDICIPVYRHDPTTLIIQLAGLEGAESTALRICDDGSNDPGMMRRIDAALALYPGRSTFLQAARNQGRTAARKALFKVAESDWILLLDSDMRIDDPGFLTTYRKAARMQPGPCCIVGGFTVDQALVTPETRLHAVQSMVSECLPARMRATDPGRYAFTSNMFLHRATIEMIPLDERFSGWGWEDVEWGLRVAARYPVIHIDNPAVHLGLETVSQILCKYQESAPNFLRLQKAHPEAVARMAVYCWARRFAALPGHGHLVAVAAECATGSFLPMRLRLMALKVYRAAVYAEALHRAGR